MPPDQDLSQWRELVELEFLRPREPQDLDQVMASKLAQLELLGEEAYQTPLSSAPGVRVFTWSVQERLDDGAHDVLARLWTAKELRLQQGVTCLRSGAGGCHVLVYAVRGPLDPATAAAWAARFQAAELLPPTY